jgi:mannose-6-phosphate isomerase-like protein (cupin superfamily)
MIVTDAGKYNIGLATMKRTYTGKPESAIVHSEVTEIYYVTEGSGTLLVGGAVTNPEELPPSNRVVKELAGPTTMGGTVRGGETRKIGKGDFVVIPAGVQHSFSSIDGSIEYLMVRVDADHLLPAGLVHEIVAQGRAK